MADCTGGSGLLGRLILVIVYLSAASCLPFDPGTVYAGSTFNITCRDHPPVTEADWVRVPFGQVEEMELCLNGVCLNGFSRWLSVDVTDNFRLTLRSVSTKDSGKYTCVVFDDSENRYVTRLTVIDPAITASSVTTTSVEQSLTTASIQSTDVWYPITIAIGAVIFIVLTGASVLIALLLVRRKEQRCRLCFGTIVAQTKTDRGSATAEKGGCDNFETKLLSADDDDIQTNKVKHGHLKPKEIATIENETKRNETLHPGLCFGGESEYISPAHLAMKDRHLFAVLLLKVFRGIDAGDGNVAEYGALSFKLVVYTSKLWWNKHIESNADKRQIRRLLYYCRSGYGRYAACTEQLQLASGNYPVMGVTVLNGNAYIILKYSNTLQVVQSNQNKHVIVVPDMKDPVDIVACTSCQGLYIADEKSRCIWLVCINQNPAKWKELKKRAPKALSLRVGALLVTTNSNIIMKYSNDEKPCSKIILPTEPPVEPQHAVETSLTTLLVAFKEGRGCNVAEFDPTGRQLRKFVCVATLLRFPSYLVLDSNGRLLVTDFENDRILLIDPNLEHACAIINQQRNGVSGPQRFCLDEATGELYVVQKVGSNPAGVAVYRMNKSAHAPANVP